MNVCGKLQSTSNSSTFADMSGVLPAVGFAAGIAALVLEARPNSNASETVKLLIKVSQISSQVAGGKNITLLQSPLSKVTSSTLTKLSKGKEVVFNFASAPKATKDSSGSNPSSVASIQNEAASTSALSGTTIAMIVVFSLSLVLILGVIVFRTRKLIRERLVARKKRDELQNAESHSQNEMQEDDDDGQYSDTQSSSFEVTAPDYQDSYYYDGTYAEQRASSGFGESNWHPHDTDGKVASRAFYDPPVAQHARTVYFDTRNSSRRGSYLNSDDGFSDVEEPAAKLRPQVPYLNDTVRDVRKGART